MQINRRQAELQRQNSIVNPSGTSTELVPAGNAQAQNVSTIIKPRTAEEPHKRVQDSPSALSPFAKGFTEKKTSRVTSFLRYNPITGEGHTSIDEHDSDLDGRKGAGTRGRTGNRAFNHQNASHFGRANRNVITGEGLRAVHCKDLSDHIVVDGDDDTLYGYFHDFRQKFEPTNLKPTELLRWNEASYQSN